MALPRFTGEISAGHISIVITLAGAAIGFYAYVSGAISNHEHRITVIEKRIEEGQKERLAFQTEMREIAGQIRSDVAVVKALLARLEERRGTHQ